MRATGIVAAAALAAACGSGGGAAWVDGRGEPDVDPNPPPVVDADRDGVPADQDCEDADPSAWTTVFAYVDADADGHGKGPLRTLCSGVTLRRGWSADDLDCDDAAPSVWQPRPLFADDDHDGAGEGPLLFLCTADVPFGYAARGDDCAPGDGLRWQLLGFRSRDADFDAHWVATTGTVCAGASLPPSHLGDWTSPAGDCDDADPAAWEAATAYRDDDRDGVGEGASVTLCAGASVPSGWAASGGDCAPGDGTRWQLVAHLGVDGDGDGVTIPQAGSICSGAALPDPYRPAERGLDCDDGDPARWQRYTAYVDGDRDGVGAGPRIRVCADDSLPAGLAAQGGDCAPLDPAAWATLTYTYRDADGDGRTVPSAGAICAGAALPAGYTNLAAGLDCEDASSAVWASVLAYVDGDHDEVGAGEAVSLCTTGVVTAGYAAVDGDCAPGDPARWRLASYAGVDRDGDGHTTREPGQLCVGAALPEPYRITAAGNDCDDGNPARYRWLVVYRDLDGDGIGGGPRSIPCLGAESPPGWSVLGFDADDADSSVHARDDVSALILLDL